MTRYDKFPIKCYGFERIWDAIGDNKCENPETFIRLAKIVSNDAIIRYDLFKFDILDSKWDVLAERLKDERYDMLFNKQLKDDCVGTLVKAEVQARLSVYAKLTGNSYIGTFNDARRYDRSEFSLLVKSGVVSLPQLFQECLDGVYGNNMKEVIWYYVKGIHNRESFDFFRFLFGKFPQQEIGEAFDSFSTHFKDDLFEDRRNYTWSSGRSEIDLKRDFLSMEETLELAGWLDEWFYLFDPRSYIEFVLCFLKDKFVSSLFKKMNSEVCLKSSPHKSQPL